MDKKSILTWLLKFVPTSILNKLQNLPPWVYTCVVFIVGGLTVLYNYYTGKGLLSEAAIVDYIKIAIVSLVGAKAFPEVFAKETDEFSPN